MTSTHFYSTMIPMMLLISIQLSVIIGLLIAHLLRD